MKKHRMPDMKEGNVNVTPLIDIVMCLIIFYMLVARIGVDMGVRQSINLPDSKVGKSLNDPGNTIVLNVERAGEDVVVFVKNPETSQMENLNPARLIPLLKKARGANKDFKAVIRANLDIDYRFIEPVLVACSQAQLKEYQFEARKP
jgi:biopolymer transport protein ExbD